MDDAHCTDGVCAADNTCVGCEANEDCTEGVCDTDANACVGCLEDGDCADGVCDTDANSCVGCEADEDCTDGVCDTDQNSCVACLADSDCPDGVCATDNTCVECTENTDCTDPTASVCDTNSNTCTACADDAGCSHLTDAGVCDTTGQQAVCVECTVDDESACGQNSCDPATNTCTNTPLGMTDTCMPCKADSECIADHRCVPMEFQGTQLADGYCLKTVSSGCARPYGTAISRDSLSGAAEDDYCGVDESLTTCAAVRDMQGDKNCHGNDSECGLSGVDDGRCERVGVFDNRCTYSCNLSSQCPSGASCGNLDGPDYCGGDI